MSDARRRSNTSTRGRNSSELRSEIEETRARLSRDIDAARTKLSRRGLQHEAISALRSVRQEGHGALGGMGDGAQQQLGQYRHMVADVVKRYPVVSTLVGVGLAMLALGSFGRPPSGPRTYSADRVPDLPAPRDDWSDEFTPAPTTTTGPGSGSTS